MKRISANVVITGIIYLILSKKNIPVNKYTLHIITCKELNLACEKCGEIISKYELDEHNSEFHTLVECGDCGKKYESRFMDLHKKKCANKPLICQYCDLKVGKNELHDHEYICGSKTEKCYNCGKYIQIRGMHVVIFINVFFLLF